MADIQAMFKITAGVAGQAAVDGLNKSVAGLNEHVGKLPGLLKGAGLAFAGLGAGLGVAVFKDKFDGLVDNIMRVKEASEKTGSSFEKIGGLVRAAKITGDDFSTVENAIIKMDKALAGSDDTAKGAARALDFLGLSVKQLKAMDPADAFALIAQKMAGVTDGAGKTAMAMDLFGKSGAQVLPFLRDLVDVGGQVSSYTEEQKRQVVEYHRATLRLSAAQQELYKVIGLQALPVANAFVNALLDVTKGTNGVKDAAKGLAADGSLSRVFVEAARAVAAFLDVASVVASALSQIKDSVSVVLSDLGVVWKGLTVNPFKAEDRAAFQATLDERNKFVIAANERLKARLDSGLTPYTDALNKRLAAITTGVTAADPDAGKKDSRKYTSRAPTDGGGNENKYQSEMTSLGAEAAKLQAQTEQVQRFGHTLDDAKAAQVQFDIEQGKFGQLSDVQRAKLMLQAEAVDRLAIGLKEMKAAAEFDKQTRQIQLNTEVLGLNTQERELAAAAQELENAGLDRSTKLFQDAMAKRRAALQQQADAKADPLLGMKQGFNELADTIGDRAAQMKTLLVGTFNKAADALTTFLTTGKLNFRDFARSVIADLVQMIVKQQMFNALKSAAGFLGFADGGAFGGAAKFANGGAFTNSVVSSPTPFRFAAGGTMHNGVMGEAGPEAVMPLTRGPNGKLGVVAQGAGGGGGDTYVTVNVQANTGASTADGDDAKSRELGQNIAAVVRAEMIRQKRPGGLLAAA